MYFEFVDEAKKSAKFWKIINNKSSQPPRVVINYGNNGKSKEFIYHDKTVGGDYMKKQIESKLKKGYIKKKIPRKKTQKQNTINTKTKKTFKKLVNTKNGNDFVTDFPNPQSFTKTSNGFSYYNIDINVRCTFKGTEPSPKGRGLCAKAVLEKQKAYGKDGNIWIKKGNRWVKMKELVKKTEASKKKCPKGKIVNPKTGRCIIDKK